LGDFVFAGVFGGGAEIAEELADLVGFEVDALDWVIAAAALDGAPFDDVVGGGAERVAHVGLLEDFFVAGAGAAIGQELTGRDLGSTGAVDRIDEAEPDGVGQRDAEVNVPGSVGIFDF